MDVYIFLSPEKERTNEWKKIQGNEGLFVTK